MIGDMRGGVRGVVRGDKRVTESGEGYLTEIGNSGLYHES